MFNAKVFNTSKGEEIILARHCLYHIVYEAGSTDVYSCHVIYKEDVKSISQNIGHPYYIMVQTDRPHDLRCSDDDMPHHSKEWDAFVLLFKKWWGEPKEVDIL